MDSERQHSDATVSDFNEAEDTASSIESVIAAAPLVTSTPPTLRAFNSQKPSLLPKPKVKVVVPPALLLQQQQLQQQQQQQEVEAEEEEEQHVTSPTTPSSRIPIRTANAERRVMKAAAAAAAKVQEYEDVIVDVVERSSDAVQREQSPPNVSKSKAMIK